MNKRLFTACVFLLLSFNVVPAACGGNAAAPAATCVAVTKTIDIGGPAIINRTKGEEIDSFMETSDRGFIFIGQSRPMKNGQKNIYVVRAGPGGELQWEKYFGQNGKVSQAADILESNNGYIIAGGLNGHPFLLAIDKSGGFLWDKAYFEDEAGGCIRSITENDGREIFAAGYVREKEGSKKSILIMKISAADGAVISSREYAGADGRDAEAYKIMRNGADGCEVSGYSYSSAVLFGIDGALDIKKVLSIDTDNKFGDISIQELVKGAETPAEEIKDTGERKVAGAAIFTDFDIDAGGVNAIFYNFFNFKNRHCVVCRTDSNPLPAGSGFCIPMEAASFAEKNGRELFVITDGEIAVFNLVSGRCEFKTGTAIAAGKNQVKLSKIIVTGDGNIAILGNVTAPSIVSNSGMSFETVETRAFITKMTPELKKIW